MFPTAVRGGYAFAAEQKIRELKKKIFRLKSLGKKPIKEHIKTYEIIKNSTDNMNSLPSRKYRVSPNEIKKNL